MTRRRTFLLCVLALVLLSSGLASGQSRNVVPRLEATQEFRPPTVQSCTALTQQRVGDQCYDSVAKTFFIYDGTSWAAQVSPSNCTTNPPTGSCTTGSTCQVASTTEWNLYICQSNTWVPMTPNVGADLTLNSLTLASPLPITSGGTNSTTASGARTALGLTDGGANILVNNLTTFGYLNASGTLTVTGTAGFSSGINVVNGIEVQSGGITVTGNSTITGTLGGISDLTASGTVSAEKFTATGAISTTANAIVGNGLSVTTGGLNVGGGGAAITGNSTITGTLGGLTRLTVASGGANITGNSIVTGTLSGLTGLTVESGGANITGNSTITGTLAGLTGLTVASGGAAIIGNSTITGTLTGLTDLTASGTTYLGSASTLSNVPAGQTVVRSSTGTIVLYSDAATADNRRWDISVQSQRFNLRVLNDAGSSATNVLTINRSGNTPTTATLAASLTLSGTSTLTVGGTLTVSDSATFNGAVSISGTNSLTVGGTIRTNAALGAAGSSAPPALPNYPAGATGTWKWVPFNVSGTTTWILGLQ